MIHFEPPPEPPEFDEQSRRPGLAWLEKNRDENGKIPKGKKPLSYWSPFREQLADGFHNLCAYSAMYEPVGTVDHYLSWENHSKLAYEWSNYRYASAWINSSKGTEDDKILDPFRVEDGWFEILLPSLQLVLTEAVPPEERERARYTLHRLHLRDDERVIRQRREWYAMYQRGELNLVGLEKKAPLIAHAIRKQRES